MWKLLHRIQDTITCRQHRENDFHVFVLNIIDFQIGDYNKFVPIKLKWKVGFHECLKFHKFRYQIWADQMESQFSISNLGPSFPATIKGFRVFLIVGE